jgi:hypothetical protein
MRVSDAVTHASGLSILLAIGAVVYIGLLTMAIWLLRRLAQDAEHLKEDASESGKEVPA